MAAIDLAPTSSSVTVPFKHGKKVHARSSTIWHNAGESASILHFCWILTGQCATGAKGIYKKSLVLSFMLLVLFSIFICLWNDHFVPQGLARPFAFPSLISYQYYHVVLSRNFAPL